MEVEGFNTEEWQVELDRSLDAAAAAVRSDEPRATSAQIELTVHQLGQDAIAAWRNRGVPVDAGGDTAWAGELHRSLDAGVALVRELDPAAAESTVVTLIRQLAQVALDNWQIGG